MHLGAAMFFTDYSMTPGELAVALEERGFELGVVARAFAHPAERANRPSRAAASCRRNTTTRWIRSWR